MDAPDEARVEIQDLVKTSLRRQGAMAAVGAYPTKIARAHVEIAIPLSDAATQQHGYFHGGVISMIADAAGGYAANTLLFPERECLTAEFKINILAPGIGSQLIAKADVLKAGKSLVITAVKVFVVNDGCEKLCAVMQQTLFVIPRQDQIG